jgi:hypothetical protein
LKKPIAGVQALDFQKYPKGLQSRTAAMGSKLLAHFHQKDTVRVFGGLQLTFSSAEFAHSLADHVW